MNFEYILTLDDAKAAEKLHIAQRPARRIGYAFLNFGIPVFAVLSLIGFYAFDIGTKNDLSLGYSIIVVILITLAIVIPFDRSKRLRRIVHPKTAQGEVTLARSIEINDEKVSAGISEMARTDFTWNAIAQVIQNEKVTLIYLNDADFILVPTRVFSTAQRTELNDLVARRATKKQSC